MLGSILTRRYVPAFEILSSCIFPWKKNFCRCYNLRHEHARVFGVKDRGLCCVGRLPSYMLVNSLHL